MSLLRNLQSASRLRIRDAVVLGDHTRVNFEAGDESVSSRFHHLFLRDHSPAPADLHPVTKQRLVDTFQLTQESVEPVDIAVSDHGAALVLTWPDRPDEPVAYPAGLLAAMAYDGRDGVMQRARPVPVSDDVGAPEPVLWDASSFPGDAAAVPYDAFMADPSGYVELLMRYGVAFVDGVPADDAAATRHALERLGPLRNTIYGTFWDFEADLDKEDTAYTDLALPAHTDGTYFATAPGYQFLHCRVLDATGGATLLVDGFAVLQQLRQVSPQAYDFFRTVALPAHYLGDGVDMVNRDVTIREDDEGRLVQFRWNNDDRAVMDLSFEMMPVFYEHLHTLVRLIRDAENEVRFQLTPGRLMGFDNWRVMHGRDAFRGRRVMAGAYLERDDIASARRVGQVE